MTMSRTLSGWTCIFAAMLFLVQTCVPANAADAGRGGEPISASRDGGEPVSNRSSSKGSSSTVWGIVVGATVIVVGGIIGYLLGEEADKDKDDAKDAAKDAAASADAAAAASAAAGAGAAEEGAFKHTIYITGEFKATAPVTGPSGAFTPSITFSINGGSGAGGIVNYTTVGDAASGQGGSFFQSYDDRIRILINEGWYNGDARVYPNGANGGYIRLENGVILDSVGGASVLMKLTK